MKRIGILGLGWLGEELAKAFIYEGFTVRGTVSSKEKGIRLREEGIAAFRYNLGESLEVLSRWENLDYIVITIPPSSHNDYGNEVSKAIQYLTERNENASYIYTSSTSIYGNRVGKVDETTFTLPSTTNALKISEVENFLTNNIPNQNVVIRLAGLVGGERHPIYFLSGRNNVSKPFTPVNLIHREDVVTFISFLVNKGFKRGVFNLCCTDHPQKNVYYEWMAKQRNIKVPNFNWNDQLKDKTVICNAIKKIGFTLKYESPYDFPK